MKRKSRHLCYPLVTQFEGLKKMRSQIKEDNSRLGILLMQRLTLCTRQTLLGRDSYLFIRYR